MAISRDFYRGIRGKRAVCREFSFCCIIWWICTWWNWISHSGVLCEIAPFL